MRNTFFYSSSCVKDGYLLHFTIFYYVVFPNKDKKQENVFAFKCRKTNDFYFEQLR